MKQSVFWSSVSGTVGPIFALVAVVLLLVMGVSIDGSRVYKASTQVARALDAAAMAAARELRNNSAASDSELQAMAAKYFDANLKAAGAGEVVYDQLSLSSDRKAGSVTVSIDTRLPTTFGKLMAMNEIDLPRSATAIDETKDIELSMMLDVSGSMGGSKITDLQVAAKELVNIIIGANQMGARNRIAIAPYSTSVNAGEWAGKASGIYDTNTCVTERPGNNAFKDKGPNGGLLNKKTTKCPSSTIVPLTNSEWTLDTHISAMSAGGMTAGHLGIAWAWYLISPEWASFWPAGSTPKPYSDPRTKKVAVIMTDGEFNTSYEPANGNSKNQSEELCDSMKAVGITIYTVAFQAPDTALPILQYCASSKDHFFDTTSGEALRKAFEEIAKSLSSLRLSG